MKNLLSTLLITTLISTSVAQADWLAFRGSNSNGIASGNAPQKFNEDSIVWEVDVPGKAASSPIVVNGQIVVTASSGVRQDRLHVISFDSATGHINWHRQFWATGRTLCHPTSANAAPTPVSDGKHIVAFFSSNDVVCLSTDGELMWYRGLGHDYPKVGNDVGMASSPMLSNGVAVCQAESQGDSFVEAMDVSNGTTLWRLERPKDSNWTSPVHLPGDGTTNDMVLLKCDENVAAHDLRTGDQVWKIDGEVGGTPSMVVTKHRIFVPGSTFLALQRTPNAPTVEWESKKIRTSPSPIADQQRIVFINNAGVLNSHDSMTGKLNWQVRVGGKYWASPVMANNLIYTVNDGGTLTVVNVEGKKVGSLKLDGNVLGTPAISEGALFVRGENKLWKIADR